MIVDFKLEPAELQEAIGCIDNLLWRIAVQEAQLGESKFCRRRRLRLVY
jgi:hypothetical protein